MAAWPIGEKTVPEGHPPPTIRVMPPGGVDAPASGSLVVVRHSTPGLMLPPPVRCDEVLSREVEVSGKAAGGGEARGVLVRRCYRRLNF